MNTILFLAQAINAPPLPKPAANDAAIATVLQIVFAIAGSVALLWPVSESHTLHVETELS